MSALKELMKILGRQVKERWRKIERSWGVILEAEAKVKAGNYVSVGVVKVKYSFSWWKYYKYYFPKGHRWYIDYLGPGGIKSLYAFVLH